MLLKYYTQYASKFGKLSSGYRTGKGQFSFQSQRKAMPKNVTITSVSQIHSWFYEHICLLSHSVVSDSLWAHGLQHDRLPCPSRTSPGTSQTHVHWVGDAIQSSSLLYSPSPITFYLSQHQGLFQWLGALLQVAKVNGASASASVLPMNIHGWFPLGLTGLISLLPKGFSRVFSNTIDLNCELQIQLFISLTVYVWANTV